MAKQTNSQYIREQLRAGRQHVFRSELPHRSNRSISRCSEVLAIAGSVVYLKSNITDFGKGEREDEGPHLQPSAA